MFWNVQVNIRTKIGLISILSLGFFASATAIYKTPMQWNFFNVTDYTGKGAWYCKSSGITPCSAVSSKTDTPEQTYGRSSRWTSVSSPPACQP